MTVLGDVAIAGAGHAGFQAAVSLREAGFSGRITLIGSESGLPYQRPPLSKAFLSGKAGMEALWFRPRTFFDKHDIELVDGDAVAGVERVNRTVRLTSGREVPYGHLILATGARARPLHLPGAELDGVMELRTLRDAEALVARLSAARTAVVVGGGFIGLEFAAVASAAGLKVTVLEALPRLMARAVSAETSELYAQAHQEWGTRVLLANGVEGILGDTSGRATAVQTIDGQRLPADLVLVGVGVLPNAELAETAGLAIDNGIVVDEFLATGDPHISAIGDCANFPSQFTGTAVRLESVENATDQARCLAARLTADARPYASVPWFWSDQRDLKLQIAGLTSGYDQTAIRGDVEKRRLSAFCFRHGRLLGVESVNRPADHMAARKLLAGPDLIADLSAEQVSDPEFDLKSYAKAQSPSPALRAEVRPLRERVRPYLVRLHGQVDETVDLSLLDGVQARFIDQIPAPHRLRAVSSVGAAFPLHCVAGGKALLAALPRERVRELVGESPARYTANTLTSLAELETELERVRTEGIAFDREEHTDGICGVAVVLQDAAGAAAAIGVPIPAARFARVYEEVAMQLRVTADACSRALGYAGATALASP